MQNETINVKTLLNTLDKDKEIMSEHLKNSRDDLEKISIDGYISGLLFCKKVINTIIKDEAR